MIISLSLNPCIDKSAWVARFQLDAPNRIRVERLDVGGKGVNVARVVKALGGEEWLAGFDYAGNPVARAMEAEGVRHRLLPLPGRLRENMKLKETKTGRTIEISEAGAEATEKDVAFVLDAVLSALRPGDWVTLSGSLPPGVGADTYRRFCQAVQEKGGLAAVDCDGIALREALQAKPALIKPNAQEFFALTGVDPMQEKETLNACQKLLCQGVGRICLSRGGEGAWLVSGDGVWQCPAAQVEALGTQGAGDTLLAGLLVALSRGADNGEALRFASAAAGASVMRPGTLLCRREDAQALLPGLRAKKISVPFE